MKNRIFIIDGSSYLYRAFHAMPPLSTSKGQPTGAVKGVTNMLMNLKKDSEGSPIIVVFDAKGKTFRNEIYSEYKANRPPMPDELRLQLDPVKSICRAIGFPLIEIEGVEADDVIATITKMAKDAKYKCVVSSLDKDLMQLVEDPDTTLMNTMKHEIFNEEKVFEKFGVKPNQIRDMLALVGDSSDNIPGVPKVGQKTAAKWLNKYSNLDGVIKNADLIKGVVGDNLRNSLSELERNVDLVTLKEDVDLNVKFEDLLKLNPNQEELDKIFEDLIENFSNDETHHASRKASGMCLNSLGPRIPELFGGSADLSPSNNTQWNGSELLKNGKGNYLSYGVREFGMSAIMNGLYLHGGFRPYGGTFLTFLDYARNAVRMSALMKLPIIYVYTHDSIGVGEDGPTHQPVEHLTILRSTPNLNTWRPCDGVETAYSWKAALTSQDKPTALILSRQNLEPQERDDHSQIAKGGYLLSKEEQSDLTIIATGSEVQLAMHAKAHLKENGLKANVVSMPCTEIFDQQDDEYKTNILGDGPRVAIECGYPDFWHKYLNQGDLVIGMESFGESAPGSVLMDHFGFTADKVSKKIISFLKK